MYSWTSGIWFIVLLVFLFVLFLPGVWIVRVLLDILRINCTQGFFLMPVATLWMTLRRKIVQILVEVEAVIVRISDRVL